jgi:pectate lyase
MKLNNSMTIVRFKHLFTLLLSVLYASFSSNLNAQVYNYTVESFESSVWNIDTKYNRTIVAPTGAWYVAYKNGQSPIVAKEGSFSFLIANTSNALVSPRMYNGVGVITFSTYRSSDRSILVKTSTDSINWMEVERYKSANAVWENRSINVNNPNVKWVMVSATSTSGIYIDNLLVTMCSAPGVTTTTAIPSDVTQISAVVGGSVASTGASTILSRGICYNTTGFPDTTSATITVPGTTGAFSTTLGGLEMGKTYYAKSFVVTNAGVSFGQILAFKTREADVPLLHFLQPFDDAKQMPATNTTSAQTINVSTQGDWIFLNANRSTNPSSIADHSVSNLYLGKSTGYVVTPILTGGVSVLSFFEDLGSSTLMVSTSTNSGATWVPFSTFTTIKGEKIKININTANVNRIKISNTGNLEANIDNISLSVFQSGTPPRVATNTVGSIAKNSAISGGNVLDGGTHPVLERGICWNTIPLPIYVDSKTSNGIGVGEFSSVIEGLPANTTIYLRAYAASVAGISYGDQVSFTTLEASIPVLTTVEATGVNGEMAISGATFVDPGGATFSHRGLCWNSTGNPTINDAISDEGAGEGAFVSKMTNLQNVTTYYYRSYATNNAGTGYGEEKMLTTSTSILPSVSTSAFTSIQYDQATCSGEVQNDGNGLTERGFCWNTTGNPTISENSSKYGFGLGAYSGVIKKLEENTRYFVRAYAKNSKGTVYGAELVLETPISNAFSIPMGFGEGTTGGGIPSLENTIVVTNEKEWKEALVGSRSIIILKGTIVTTRTSVILKNKTILGLPGSKLINNDQTNAGSGILYLSEGSTNVIIRNVSFEGPGAYDTDGYDLLTNKGCIKLWVDHCDFQDGCDDSFDNTGLSDNITVSWCKFSNNKPPVPGGSGGSADHRYANLIGGADSDFPADGHYSLTFHHNWYTNGVVSRMVRARNGELHLLNNYWNSNTADVYIGLTAGTNGTTCYVEGGVIVVSSKVTVADVGSGACYINFVNCINGKANVGSIRQPSYSYNALPSNQVVNVVTDATCGAGANLLVTESGEVYKGCTNVAVLSANGNLIQTVFNGNEITPVEFSWLGGASDVLLANLPAGLIFTKNGNKMVVSGIPTESGTFTATTVNAFGLPAQKSVSIMLTTTPPPTISSSGQLAQNVVFGESISPIVFTYGGGATDVRVLVPKGLSVVKDATAKTATISGCPTSVGVIRVVSIGGSGQAVSAEATINLIYSAVKLKIAYVTSTASATYVNDTRILPSLKADPNIELTEVNSTETPDFSGYDLVLISEVAPSADPAVLALEGIAKPVITMKVHSYKSTAWNWTSSTTVPSQSTTETNLIVSNINHPIFKDVTNWINGNEVEMISGVSSLKGLTFMDPAQFSSRIGTINSLAYLKGDPSQVSILQMPMGTRVGGVTFSRPFIQIGINSNSYENVTDDGISIIKNSIYYALGILPEPTGFQIKKSPSVRIFPTLVKDKFFIHAEKPIEFVKLFSIDGRPVLICQPKTPSSETSVSAIPDGIYFVVIKTENDISSFKIEVTK